MTDYSKMSDFEINKLVAIQLGMKPFCETTGWQGLTSEPYVDVIVRGAGRMGAFNPCNNPSDAWRIICESLISISPHYKFTDESEEYISHSNDWVADNVMRDGKSFRYKGINPLRAAMIVYLMMKESENG